MTLHRKDLFVRACAAFDLPKDRCDAAWRTLSDLGLDPDDPTVIFLAMTQAVSAHARNVETLVDQVPELFRAQASQELRGLLYDTQREFAAGTTKLIASVEKGHLAIMRKSMARRDRRNNAAVLLSATALVFGIVLAAGLAGWIGGRSETSGLADRFATVASEPYADGWVWLAKLNPGMDVTKLCHPASERVVKTTMGQSGCNLFLRVAETPPPTTFLERAKHHFLSYKGWITGIVLGIAFMLGWGFFKEMWAKYRAARQSDRSNTDENDRY